jgi:ABC-type Na+ transport system ATPase subunit NatA
VDGSVPRVPAIDVSGLVVRYPGGVTAVDGLSFSAEAGEVVALLGPNGAGKTTTVETLEAPGSGSCCRRAACTQVSGRQKP